MREIISKSESIAISKLYKKDKQCCLIELNGKKLKTRFLYFEKLKKKLQLNDSFSNNLNAYSDMMRDAYTYYNKEKIIFLIKHYRHFLEDDPGKDTIEKIFDDAIIPYFETEIEHMTQNGTARAIHVYCVM
ncbi:MAG: barstar family protein [Vallitaleaceae bacterium]|jgi:RNAse (barnase) inhibitor barstar|nr:barstar family protein [Vallitaleaceae bacterium]